ncbi:unnamed protein product [Effrenium voratum]|uniref:Uncharacterized protein n=1 Tax=Effrenium voratum TaxID=2562239 RepID=A0AA36NKP1_9DINO|nr:unnamed protein product [Effrenium voratum]
MARLLALPLTAWAGQVLAPDLPPQQVEVLVNGSRPEELLAKADRLGPLLQNESKLGEFGYTKHPKKELRWDDLRSIIKGRKCSTEKADEQCGELVCRKGLCSFCTRDSECPSLHRCVESSNGRACRAMERKAWESAWQDRSECLGKSGQQLGRGIAPRFLAMFSKNFPVGLVFIVLVEFCERTCYYTFAGTQKTWLQEQGYSNSQSSSINLTWAEVCYVCCFFGGWLASTRVGIFRTIAGLSLTYALGTYLSAFAALPQVESTGLYLLGTFGLVALGSGGIKPNVCTMGANQFDPADPEAEQNRASFFLYFYLTINLGSALSHAFLSSWATSGVPGIGVDIEHGYFFAWMIAASLMLMAFLLFVGGKSSYRKAGKEDVEEEPVVQLFIQTLRQGSGSVWGKLAIFGWVLIPVFIVVSIVNAFVESPALKAGAVAMAVACIGSLVIAHLKNPSWLPESDVRRCLDCVPLLLVGNLFFGILQSTISSVFQSQACQMDTRQDHTDFSFEGFQYSGDFFRLANPVTIVIGTPLLDRVVYPFVRKLTGKEVGIGFKVILGFGFAIGAQLVAASIEFARKSSPVLAVASHCAPMVDGEHVHMSGLNSFYMLAPYAMVGFGEIMVNPVLQHLAYEGAPASMKSLLQAFNLFAMGALPNGVASVISQALKSQVPNDLNQGNLPLVYFINSAIGVVGIFAFFVVLRYSPTRAGEASAKVAKSDAIDTEL